MWLDRDRHDRRELVVRLDVDHEHVDLHEHLDEQLLDLHLHLDEHVHVDEHLELRRHVLTRVRSGLSLL